MAEAVPYKPGALASASLFVIFLFVIPEGNLLLPYPSPAASFWLAEPESQSLPLASVKGAASAVPYRQQRDGPYRMLILATRSSSGLLPALRFRREYIPICVTHYTNFRKASRRDPKPVHPLDLYLFRA